VGTEITHFDFEEEAVRVLMRDGPPWFVAAEV
jgi:prophage antirepressor-like protein